ncbi:MAG: sulfatase [Myxococcota bacterium]
MSRNLTSGRWAVLIFFVLATAGVLSCSDSIEDKRPTGSLEDLMTLAERDDLNVLFILVDTLRADRLSSYGYERETSPVMDYLAGTGLRFQNHRAQSSWTKTSMASLWTGLYPIRTDVLQHNDALIDDAKLPAEVFRDAGYVTAGIWRNGWVAPNFGFSQGFDVYLTPALKQAPAVLRKEANAGRIDGTDIDLVFAATEFIRTYQDEKWFLYLHLMDVHQYISTEETAIFGNTYSDAYDNSILWTDSQLGVVLSELYRLGLEDRTVVVLVSDHGEAFGEHGSEGHGRDVYQEVVGTPFIISLPFKLDPAGLISANTENVDVWPTLFEMLGLPAGIQEADGISRVPLLLGDKTPPSEDLGFAMLDRNWGRVGEGLDLVMAVREGPLRLVHNPNDPKKDQLYNIQLDPMEQRNLAAEQPKSMEQMTRLAEEHKNQTPAWQGGAPEVEIDEMHLRQLRAIGYVIDE